MKILLIVNKNTACLDFTLPVLFQIKKEYPKSFISVLFCRISRYNLLRNGKFYLNFFKSNNINVYDFLDFYRATKIKKYFIRNFILNFGERDVISNQRVISKLKLIRNKYYTKIEKQIDYDSILQFLAPDKILFDNTARTQFYGRSSIYKYLYDKKKDVFLLPHAPHHSSCRAFTPFDDLGEKLPKFCIFWKAYKYDKTEQDFPDRKDQFKYVGYPGFDSEWLKNLRDSRIKHDKKITCLFIIRRFTKKELNCDRNFVYDYEEFEELVECVKDTLDKINCNVDVILKPHPSNDYNELREFLKKHNLSHWKISYETIYALLDKIDIVVSLYSTILLVPVIAGIPTILLNSRINRALSQKEKTMKKLYERLSFFANDNKAFSEVFTKIITLMINFPIELHDYIEKDKKHIREFFPDNASDNAIRNIFYKEN